MSKYICWIYFINIIDKNMIKDNIYHIFIKKISLNFFNIFIFIYFKN